MTAPTWSPVDSDTADLLDLVADTDHPSVDHEWHAYCMALTEAVDGDTGRIDPNRFRDLVRGVVAPKRIGALTNRALKSGLIEWRGEWVESTDTEGRNAGRPIRSYVLAESTWEETT